MIAEQREKEESLDRYKNPLVEKLESYLRAHFDEESAKHYSNGAMERLLLEVGQDWCLNHGVPMDTSIVWDACEEAIKRYRKNWKGKEQGEDTRGDNFGEAGNPTLKKYGGEIA